METSLSYGKYRKLTTEEQEGKQRVKQIPTIKTPQQQQCLTNPEASLSQRRTTWYAGQKEDTCSNDSEPNRCSDSLVPCVPKESNLQESSKQNSTRHSAPLLSDNTQNQSEGPTFAQRHSSESSDLNLKINQVRLRKKKVNLPDLRKGKAATTFDGVGNSNKNSRPVSAFFSSGIMKRPQNSQSAEAMSLHNTLDSKKMRTAFHDFLDSEYSSENLKFWCSCEKFKKLKTADQRYREGAYIYEQFISSKSPHQVNIDHVTQRQVALSMSCGDSLPVDVFDTAQRKIFNIMENDSYPRFLRSNYYKEAANRRTPLESLLVTLLPGNRSSSGSKANSPTKESGQMRNASNNNNTSPLTNATVTEKRNFKSSNGIHRSTGQCPQLSTCPCEDLLKMCPEERDAFVQRLCEPTKHLNHNI